MIPYHMFEEFSDSYFIGRLFVRPGDSNRPTIQQAQLERINDHVLDREEALADLRRPVVMKVGTHHIPVHGDAGVPEFTLELPKTLLEAAGIENSPSVEGVLLAKEAVEDQLLWLTGHHCGEVGI